MEPIEEYPVPNNQEEIWEAFEGHEELLSDDPSIAEIHEEYLDVIASYDNIVAFHLLFPLSWSQGVYVWDREFGEGFYVSEDEFMWHRLKNFFVELVEEEGDCRDAEFSDLGTMPSGSKKMKCEKCGHSDMVG